MNDFSYCAGFVDADGHISINKQKNNGFVAALVVVNANLRPLYVLQAVLGGRIYEKKPRKDAHSVTYHLTWTNRKDISGALDKLIPYLVGKQDIALLVKEFVDSRLLAAPNRGNHVGYSDREKELYKQVKLLGSKFYKKPRRIYE